MTLGDLTCGVALQAAASEAEPGAAPGAHRASWLRLRHELGARPLWQAAGLGVRVRPRHDPHGRSAAPRTNPAGAWPRQSIMRCGSTGRSASMSGCGTGSAAPCTPEAGGPATGEFYDGAGRLVATCAQEVSLRYVTTPPPGSA